MVHKVTVVACWTVLVGVGACADGAQPRHDLTAAVTVAALHAAPDTVAAAGSGRFEMRVTALQGGDEVAITSSGVFAQGRVSVDIDLADTLSRAANEVGRSLPADLAGPAQVVIDADTVYLRFALWEELLGGIGWVSLTTDDLESARGFLGFDVAAFDPVRLVDTLRRVSGEIEERGHEQVRGVNTRHVSAVVEQGPRLDVWIDDDDLVRRVLVVDDIHDLGRVSTTLELFAYGEPLEVVVPPPPRTTPLRDLLTTFGAAP